MDKEIKFKELANYNDSNSVVWTSLIMRDEDLSEMDVFFHDLGFIKEDKHLVDWKHISDNVRGDNGRSDILLIFDNPNSQFNPIVRLQLGYELKWTSDFINNYSQDYISGNHIVEY